MPTPSSAVTRADMPQHHPAVDATARLLGAQGWAAELPVPRPCRHRATGAARLEFAGMVPHAALRESGCPAAGLIHFPKVVYQRSLRRAIGTCDLGEPRDRAVGKADRTAAQVAGSERDAETTSGNDLREFGSSEAGNVSS